MHPPLRFLTCSFPSTSRLILAALFLGALPLNNGCSGVGSGGPKTTVEVETFLVEELPGSQFHAPDGTWWGYNMKKIARRGNIVFTTVIENDDQPLLDSNFRILYKVGDGVWESGPAFPTNRPGNILLDPAGGLHALVFEATDPAVNDSIGSLKHYHLAGASLGDFSGYSVETVVSSSDSVTETVNIRVGAAADEEGRLALAYGLSNQSVHAWVRTLSQTWVHHEVSADAGHEYYYPFVQVGSEGVALAPVQDDYVPADSTNLYQKAPLFRLNGSPDVGATTESAWMMDLLADFTSHPLAASRRRLVEQSDFSKSPSTGRLHLVLKEFLDEEADFSVSRFVEVTSDFSSTPQSQELAVGSDFSLNWLRRFEVSGEVFYLGTSWDSVYLFDSDLSDSAEIDLGDLKGKVTGIYPYLADGSSGTQDSELYLDIVLLNGDSSQYPSGKNAYIRIEKSNLLSAFQQ